MTKHIFIYFFFLLPAFAVVAQSGGDEFGTSNPRAKQMFHKGFGFIQERQLRNAEVYLKKAIEYDSNYAAPHMSLADVYRMSGRWSEALEVYRTLNRIVPEYPDAYYNLGSMLLDSAKYSQSSGALKEFIQNKKSPPKYLPYAKDKLKRAEFGEHAINNPVPFDPKNVGSGVNSQFHEYWPTVTADEQTMIFTRRKPTKVENMGMIEQEDIYVSHKLENGKWGEAKLAAGRLNTEQNEGAITISPDGKWIIFTGCNREDGSGSCDLYVARYDNGQWSKPRNLGPPINTRWKETQPSLSFDGSALYFSSNRPGSFGGLDIWMSKFDVESGWGEPINLGKEVNTKENEQSPFIHHDDNTLYFSTRGHVGMGGIDLFKAKRTSDSTFSQVENLGYPINTNEDELAIFVSSRGNQAYYSSGNNSMGGLDIFSFELHEEARPEPVTYVKGFIYDNENLDKLGAKLQLIDLETGKTVVTGESDPVTGEVLVSIPANKDYALNVSKEGYLFYSDHLPLKEYESTEPYQKDIGLSKIKVGNTMVLRNIFYAVDSFDLKPKSRAELDRLVNFMKENPKVKIEIGGHTDSTASDDYNLNLSEKRAGQVHQYLIKTGGIDEGRLSWKGYGRRNPIASNKTAEGRALNRRTEIKIVEM